MNKKHLPYDTVKQFPLEQLQKFIHSQNNHKKKLLTKQNLLITKGLGKNHSKSLYYYKNFNNQTNELRRHQKIIMNSKLEEANKYTINQQILCPEQKKPGTQECRSGRNNSHCQKMINIDTRNNRISLRSSSHYTKLSSVAGVPLNEKFVQDRKDNYLITKQNMRKLQYHQIEKENQRLAKKLQNKQSQYSTKKLLKAYENQQKISKRLSESKLSQRSSQSKRSISSQKSQRNSIYSNSSRNSSRSSLKSTSRSGTQGFNRFNMKYHNQKNVKIVEHNINKINKDELNKFKSLFANSFSVSDKKQAKQLNLTIKNQEKFLSKEKPHAVDIDILSEKSQSTQNRSRKRLVSGDNLIAGNHNKKLRFSNLNDKNRISSSPAPSFGNLLHKIAEQMYSTDNNTQDILKDEVKKVKTNTIKNYRNLIDKKPAYIVASTKYSIFSTNDAKA